jgi:hypothetical protein
MLGEDLAVSASFEEGKSPEAVYDQIPLVPLLEQQADFSPAPRFGLAQFPMRNGEEQHDPKRRKLFQLLDNRLHPLFSIARF